MSTGAPIPDSPAKALPEGVGERWPTAELRTAFRGFLRAIDAFDDAIGHHLAINRTDLRCLDLLEEQQPLSAGELARGCGTTTGAMTFVLDRLERAGFVRRTRDGDDRRRVLVELEPAAHRRARALHDPMVRAARAAFEKFSADEVATITRFLSETRRLYEQHGAALRDGADREEGVDNHRSS